MFEFLNDENNRSSISTAIDNGAHGEDRLQVLSPTQTQTNTVIICDGATVKGDGSGGRAANAAIASLTQELTQIASYEYEQYVRKIPTVLSRANERTLESGGLTTVSIVHDFGPEKDDVTKHRLLILCTDDSPIIVYNTETQQYKRYPRPGDTLDINENLSDGTIYRQKVSGPKAIEWLDNCVVPPRNTAEEALNKSRRRIHSYLGKENLEYQAQWLVVPSSVRILVASDGITDVLPIETTEESKKLKIPSICDLLAQGKSAPEILEIAKKISARGKSVYFRSKSDDRCCAIIDLPKAKNIAVRTIIAIKNLATGSQKTPKEIVKNPYTEIDEIVASIGADEAHRGIKQRFGGTSNEYNYFLTKHLIKRGR